MARVVEIDVRDRSGRDGRADTYGLGDGEERHVFVHADVRFLEGRAPGVERAIGSGMLRVLQEFFRGDAKRFDLQLTVEIRDIQREAYFKLPEGTFTPQ